jgi:hypothetical protein
MIRRILAALLLTAGMVSAQDTEWETAVGQRDQVTKGLVSYWAMRNSGTTALDEYGANNGTAVNGPAFAYTNGCVQNGVFCDGVNDYIGFGDFIRLDNIDFTVSVWVRMSATNASGTLIAKDKGSVVPLEREWDVYIGGGVATLYTFPGGVTTGYKSVTQSGNLNDLNWHHVAFTYLALTRVATLYVDGASNGVSEALGSAMANTTAQVMVADRELDENHAYLKAYLDETRIYNRALTADEIKQLYRMGKTIFQNR